MSFYLIGAGKIHRKFYFYRFGLQSKHEEFISSSNMMDFYAIESQRFLVIFFSSVHFNSIFFMLYFISFWFDKKVIWCICQLMNLIDKFPPSFYLKQNSYCKFSNIYKKNPPRQNNQLFSKSVNKIQSFNLLI